jgi:hypothetical protein
MVMKKSVLSNWITNGTAKPFYARKEFTIEKELASATAYVCGLGQFLFYVNGEKVGDHELDPGWTDYNKYVQYVTFDVLSLLKQGNNAVGAEVGNGWFHMELSDGQYSFHFPTFMPPNPNPYKPFGDSLILGVTLHLTYTDGSTQTVLSDESWSVKEHPIVSSNIFSSEKMDGSLVQEGWCEAGFLGAGWKVAKPAEAPKGILKEQFQPPVKVIKDYEAQYLHDANGREIYDLGQEVSGMLEFQVKGKAGMEIKLYPAEKLSPDGDADQMAKNWMMIDNCITYVIGADDVWETYHMKFTYFAGRYFAVEGAGRRKSDHQAQIRGIVGHAITSAHQTDGAFTCDDKRYEQIYDLVEKAVEANMLSVHTDCPTIERFAWQEPNHLMAPSIMYMKDGKLLWKKFLTDMRMAQHTKDDVFKDYEGQDFYPGDGLMPSQAPCYIPNALPVPGMGSFYDIIPWGSTCILGTYWHYIFYGDVSIIEENYEAGKRYLNYLKTKVTEDGFINHGLGDWGNPVGEFARENIETAFLYADAKTLAYFAEILGKEEEQKEFLNYAKEIQENYNEKLLILDEATNRYCYRVWGKDELVMTQASQALPLYWGMVPKEKEADIVETFREILKRDQSFLCGEVGQPYVIQCASGYGMNDLIAKFILKETHPSYYAFVLAGETTLGEYWEENPRSHCHDMMGHIVEWYYNGIAGIKPVKPGFSKVVIKPYLPESMQEMSCTYKSVNGPIQVSMKRVNNKVELHVDVADKIAYTVDDSNLI